jgi:hypothetical protein
VNAFVHGESLFELVHLTTVIGHNHSLVPNPLLLGKSKGAFCELKIQIAPINIYFIE